jgi:tetratricopeptide (TPR) repeat protein
MLMGYVLVSLAMAQSDPIADAVTAVHDARNRGDFAESCGTSGSSSEAAGAYADYGQQVRRVDNIRGWSLFTGRPDGGGTRCGLDRSGPPALERQLLLSASSVDLTLPKPDPVAEATLQSAREALQAGRTEDAFVLALRALDEVAPTNEAIFSEMPVFASMLALKHARGKADQLWDRLFVIAEARSVDTLLPLLHVTREHARFLAEWPDRTPSARAAIAQYRDLLTTAHGPDSQELATVLRMTIEFEQDHDRPQAAAAAAEELLALASSINGQDGIGNLTAIQTAAGLYEMQGNAPRVRKLYERAIAIADTARNHSRAGIRIQAAYALAHQGDFDGAERLAREAVALDPEYADDLEQVLELRADAVTLRAAR